jgi:hypothetical protein
LLSDFKGGFKEFEGHLTKTSIEPDFDIIYSPALSYMQAFISAINSVCMEERTTTASNEYLKRILLSTPNIIRNHKVEPKDEADVRNAIWRELSLAFPETMRDVPIPKIFQTFKPDIGITSLKTAVEYKFVDTSEELKTAVRGIYEDVTGYEGSTEWEYFYAVVYQTEPFCTLDQLIAEFKMSNVPKKWQLILVGGYGDRERLRKATDTKKKVKTKREV